MQIFCPWNRAMIAPIIGIICIYLIVIIYNYIVHLVNHNPSLYVRTLFRRK